MNEFKKQSIIFDITFADISIPRVPVQKVSSETGRRHSKDATEEDSIKELTSKLEEVASQHAEKVIKSRPASGRRSGDDPLENITSNIDPKGNYLLLKMCINCYSDLIDFNKIISKKIFYRSG